MVSAHTWRCAVLVVSLVCAVVVVVVALAWPQTTKTATTTSLGPRAVPSLKFFTVISRHGNRRSYFTYPNDPYNTTQWHVGLSELSEYGRLQMYNLGVKLRGLYSGFLSELYSPEVLVESTMMDRTMLSGAALVAGLFPPQGYEIWDKDLLWQPIPIYDNSSDKTSAALSCTRYGELILTLAEQYNEDYSANLTALSDYMSQYTGANTSEGTNVFEMWDILIGEYTEGFTLPAWTEAVFPEPMSDLIGEMYITYFGSNEEEIQLLMGSFLREMLTLMESKVNGSLSADRQMVYYSGHDSSIIALQATLGIPTSDMIGMVKPGSAMIFELHQDPTTLNFSVQVLYIDGSSEDLEPVELDIPDCPAPCAFDRLVNITQKFWLTETEYDEMCQSNSTSDKIAETWILQQFT